MFYIVYKVKEMLVSLQSYIQLQWRWCQMVPFLMYKQAVLKNQNWILLTCDSLALIMLHIYI